MALLLFGYAYMHYLEGCNYVYDCGSSMDWCGVMLPCIDRVHRFDYRKISFQWKQLNYIIVYINHIVVYTILK